MPLTKIQKKLKIVPTGSFHEEIKILPEFLKNFDQKQDFKTSIELLIGADKLEKTRGNTMVIENIKNADECLIFFNSTSHIVLTFNKSNKQYQYDQIFVNDEEKIIKKQTLENEKKIKLKGTIGVFTSQLSSCSFQMALVGGTSSEPTYLIFSHIQTKGVLKEIISTLDLKTTDIHCILNYCIPDLGSIESSLNGIIGFIDEEELLKKTITLVRDSYFWPNGYGLTGYGLAYAGFYLNGTKLKAQYSIGVGPLFTNSLNPTIQIPDLHEFNVFNKDQKTIIKLAKLEKGYNSIITTKRKQADKLYFDLFITGKLGDKYIISNSTVDNEILFKNFTNYYNFKSLMNNDIQNLKNLMKKPNETKTITWIDELECKDLISQITDFKIDSSQYFVDLSIGTPNFWAKEAVKKSAILLLSESKSSSDFTNELLDELLDIDDKLIFSIESIKNNKEEENNI